MNESPLVTRTGWIGFGLVAVSTLVVYLMTMAPTLSFWDCGEFIASSSILGIPHPPGSPLYVFVGRLFSILPLADDPAVRVNLLSALSSAVAAGFLFLIVMAATREWEFTGSRKTDLFVRLLGSACGGWVAAFGLTQWNNSVEAEVYGLAMAILFAVALLTLGMVQTENEERRGKFLLAAVFLSVLGVAVHMTVALLLPVLLIAGALRPKAPRSTYTQLLIFVLFSLGALIALSSQPGELPLWLFGIPIGLITLLMLTTSESNSLAQVTRLFSFAAIAPIVVVAMPNAASALGVIGVVGSVGMIGSVLYWRFQSRGSDNRAPQSLVLLQLSLVLLLVIQLLRLTGLLPFLAIVGILGCWYLWSNREHIAWPILISLSAVLLVVSAVIPFLWTSVGAVVFALGAATIRIPGWRLGVAIPIVALVGFSFHLTIPVRSAEHPLINENAPYRSFQAFRDFIERKQYGSESMLERMFVRRAEWTHQFGTYQRIGLYGYLQEQSSSRQLFAPFLLLAAIAIWELVRRKPKEGSVLVILLLLATVGLVLYMNFADGTRIDPRTGEDYLEVRERDYFYTPGFMLFGSLVGLGLLSLLSVFSRVGLGSIRSVTVPLFGVIACLLPYSAIAANWKQVDRSTNFIPYDYARALLDSVEPNGVLITAGDNDTFSLWCLQHTYNYRPDVRVVNTSLANLDWYISQMQDYFNLPIGLSDSGIAALRPYRVQDGRVFMISDQVVNSIIERYADSLPIYFATTVPADQRSYEGRNIDHLLVLEGIALRFTPTNREGMTVNREKSARLFLGPDGFHYRGFVDPRVRKDGATLHALGNIANSVEATAEAFRSDGDYATAERLARLVVDSFPRSASGMELLVTVLQAQGRQSEVDSILALNRDIDLRRVELSAISAVGASGDTAGALTRLRALLDQSPNYRPALDELIRLHLTRRDVAGMLLDLGNWARRNPDDQEMREAYEMFKADTTLLYRARQGQ